MEQKTSLFPFKLTKFAYLSLAAAILTLGLKTTAYIWTNSIGILSDALETIINLISSVVLVITISISFQPPNRKYTYGQGKVEYIATALEGCLILLASFFIIAASYHRIVQRVVLSHVLSGVYVAILSALINFGVGMILIKAAKRYDSVVLEADGKHLLTDVWTTCGVVVGLGIMHFCPKHFWFLDPAFAIMVSLHIAKTGFALLKKAYLGLMDASLPEEEIKVITSIIKKVGGPRVRFHCLKTRRAGKDRFIEFHLVLPGYTTVKDSHDICCLIEQEIQKKLSNSKVLIHIEPEEDEDSWDSEIMGGRSDEEV